MGQAMKEFLFWAGLSLVGVAWVVKGGTNGANFVKALGSSAAGFAQAVSGQSVTTLGG
jgi:hypothetical protein